MLVKASLLVAAFVVGLLIALNAQADARTYYDCRQGTATCVRTTDGEMIDVNDDAVNVDGIADNFVSSARNVRAVVASIIPAMLPDAGGECGVEATDIVQCN